MTLTPAPYTPRTMIRTDVTCTKCHKATSVPFTPTPGRPVYCRECFATAGPSNGPRGAPGGGGGFNRGAPAPRFVVERKRMMAQGRKTHFIYDAKTMLAEIPGGMELKDNRAFLEGLFARGARTSTEAAQIFLEEKVADGDVTHEQAIQLGRLIDKYSFAR